MKRIGILTQPLHTNYGGLLQAYALQKVLRDQGHDVVTVDFSKKESFELSDIKKIAINAIRKYVLKRNVNTVFPLSLKQKNKIGCETNRFISQNIKTTQKLIDISELSYLKSYKFDAYVVGSDQVWRPRYSPGLSAFFLEFLENDSTVKRISYAASFGVDHCDEYTSSDLDRFSKALNKFDAVGVREDSAIELCKKYFLSDATQVLDPTLLLDVKDYIALVEYDEIAQSDGNMFVYVLDKKPEKDRIIEEVSRVKNLKAFTVMPKFGGVYPPVTQWLRSFMDAKFVVTDSFHGVAFSILFNKQFVAIGNVHRGLSRFTSILRLFGLEDRLITEPNDFKVSQVEIDIDYYSVNIIMDSLKISSLKLLNDNLS